MPAITLKNIPDELYSKIKKSAKLNFRSLNSEILFRLKSSIAERKPNVQELLKKIHQLNTRMDAPKLTDEFIKNAKNEGRL